MQTLLNVREHYWYTQTPFKIRIRKYFFTAEIAEDTEEKQLLRQKPEGKRQKKSAK